MIRFLIRAVIFLGSAALGIWITSLIVNDFTLDSAKGFVIAVVVFAVLQSILAPWLVTVTRRHATALTGAVGLISTFLALLVATLVNDGITIGTVTAWFLGTILVWLITMLGTLLLPVLLVKNRVEERRAGA